MTTLETALATYKTRMSTSNRQFWTSRVAAVSSDPSLTDHQRIDLLAQHFSMRKWPRSGHGSDITHPSQFLIPRGEPGHIELGIDSDGTLPPTDVAARTTFLTNLDALLAQHFPDAPPPEEYHLLLSLTDAISDPDFAHKGIAGINGVCGGLPDRQDLSDMLPDYREWAAQGWTVYGGWRCGLGDEAAVQLLYTDREDDGERELKWRVYAYDRSDFPEGRWFESIADYLLWKCEWLQRLPPGWETAILSEPYANSQASDDEDDDEDEDEGEDGDEDEDE